MHGPKSLSVGNPQQPLGWPASEEDETQVGEMGVLVSLDSPVLEFDVLISDVNDGLIMGNGEHRELTF